MYDEMNKKIYENHQDFEPNYLSNLIHCSSPLSTMS